MKSLLRLNLAQVISMLSHKVFGNTIDFNLPKCLLNYSDFNLINLSILLYLYANCMEINEYHIS